MVEPDELPRAIRMLWQEPRPPRGAAGLSRDRIVEAAIALADVDGIESLSMARLAERLSCGTMSLYRHIANKDELVALMLSAAPGPPPPSDASDWRAALIAWADGLWDVYHRHRWLLRASAVGPPADPGQLAWLDAGLAALWSVNLTEREKVSSVISLLHYVRGAAGLAIDAAAGGATETVPYSTLLRTVLDVNRFPALAAAIQDGAFTEDDPQVDFTSGVHRVLDGIATAVANSQHVNSAQTN